MDDLIRLDAERLSMASPLLQHWSGVQTLLIAPAWVRHLSCHPDPHFAAYILGGIQKTDSGLVLPVSHPFPSFLHVGACVLLTPTLR